MHGAKQYSSGVFLFLAIDLVRARTLMILLVVFEATSAIAIIVAALVVVVAFVVIGVLLSTGVERT